MIDADDDTVVAPARRPVKSEAAFRTISEVSDDLEVPQHVLRFWESKFTQIKPLKRGGGRRYYRPEDIAVLVRIRDLLYKDGFTIRGAQKHLREGSRAAHKPAGQDASGSPQPEPAAQPEPLSAEPSIPVIEEPVAPLPPPSTVKLVSGAGRTLPGDYRVELESLLDELVELRSLLADAKIAVKG